MPVPTQRGCTLFDQRDEEVPIPAGRFFELTSLVQLGDGERAQVKDMRGVQNKSPKPSPGGVPAFMIAQ